MRKIILDGSVMTGREALHDALCAQLALPEYYGRNLDAMYDCLTTMPETEIELRNWPQAGYLARALDVMRDAAEDNILLRITVVQ